MKAAGKAYEPVTYEGAGHGFMRAGVDPNNTVEGNKKAREEGFARLTTELAKIKVRVRSRHEDQGYALLARDEEDGELSPPTRHSATTRR